MSKVIDWTLTVVFGGAFGVMVVAAIGMVHESTLSANAKVFWTSLIVIAVVTVISFVLFVASETRKRNTMRPKR